MPNKLLLALSGILLAAIIYLLCFEVNKVQLQKVEIEKRDTIYKIIQKDPIEIVRTKPKLRIVRDTVIHSPEFIATVDTVIRRDTIRAEYEFPQNLLSLQIRQSPDSMMQERITIHTKEYIDRTKWWEKPLIAIAGIVVGIVVEKVGK